MMMMMMMMVLLLLLLTSGGGGADLLSYWLDAVASCCRVATDAESRLGGSCIFDLVRTRDTPPSLAKQLARLWGCT
ncbi:hypothetical protein FN846DRAFT_977731 [Sphaerosporella brunnea]|uniref:Secreted protein n=1 Tax=Sphaerosporella brunnea TaxID=1250544 RepID=A0A5J5EFI9_9PEZI|nr:hypothetical protein FN846DRAFT_977731 [Sphaerosporella brunnea]